MSFLRAVVSCALVAGCGGDGGGHKHDPDPTPVTLPDGGAAAARLIVTGDRLVDPGGADVVLRGFNWGAFDTAEQQDAADNVAMGANVVRIPLSFYFDGDGDGPGVSKQDAWSPGAPGNLDPALLATVDRQVDWAVSAKLWVIVMVRGGDDDFWTNAKVIPQFLAMWSFLAKHYANVPNIAAYELLSEPHPPKPLDNGDVRKLYQEAIARVRAVDARTPVMIGAAKDYELRDLEDVFLEGERDVIYTANFYELPAYVKQTKNGADASGYPGRYRDQARSDDRCDASHAGQTVTMNKAFLGGLLRCVTRFRDAHHVPVFVDQVGIRSGTPDSLQYAKDVLDLFRAEEVGFTYWTYRTPSAAHTMGADDIGVLYQTDDGAWHRKAVWLDVLGEAFRGRETE